MSPLRMTSAVGGSLRRRAFRIPYPQPTVQNWGSNQGMQGPNVISEVSFVVLNRNPK